MTRQARIDGRRGFTLLEVMAALGLLASGFLAVAQLLVVASRASHLSRMTTMAASLATRQLERLHSLAWGFAADGTAVGTIGLSPPGALAADTVGFVDYLDDGGASVGGGLLASGPGDVHPAMVGRAGRWPCAAADGRAAGGGAAS